MAVYVLLVSELMKNKSLTVNIISRPKLSVNLDGGRPIPPTQHANQVQWSFINDIQKNMYEHQ